MVKIKDIAKIANLSPTTVSRVLNNDKNFSVRPETKAKVFRAADKLGYKTEDRILNKESFNIAVVQWISSNEEENDLYYQNIRQAVESACITNKISSVKFYKENFDELFLRNDIDGILCIGKFTKKQVEKLYEYNEYLIFVDSQPDNSRFSTVQHDLKKATKIVLDYLEEMGHRRIGFIGGHETAGDENYLYYDVREQTFIKERIRRNLETKDHDIYFGVFDADTGFKSIEEAYNKNEDMPSAFICASDSIAIGALSAVSSLNIDLSIISFDDISTAKYLHPPLTTVSLDTNYMAEASLQMLLLMIKTQNTSPFKLILSTNLIIRKSVKKI